MRNLFIITFLLMSSTSWAASFNCDKAISPIENLICGNAELSQLDNKLSVTYKRALVEMSHYGKDALIVDQKQWIESQRNKCHDINCLKVVYRLRTDELKKWNEEASNHTDIVGHYWMPRRISVNSIVENGRPLETEERNCLILAPGTYIPRDWSNHCRNRIGKFFGSSNYSIANIHHPSQSFV